ncbi:MAG: hypothetical protein DDT25_00130 [Chloroflexi bacterium]|nr:hypothetical protein [Chloroflexota bacterium]
MPAAAAPYGLAPINLIGGQVFAGQTRLIPIASGAVTPIFYGDIVSLSADGTLVKDVGTTTATPVGVFLGCTFSDPVFGQTFRQFYPGNVVAPNIEAYVQDDPDQLYRVAVVTAGTVIGTVQRTNVGNNTSLVQNPGNTVTGNSRVAVSATTATTATLPVRIIDVVPESSPAGTPTLFTEVIVKWNAGVHQYNNPTGV